MSDIDWMRIPDRDVARCKHVLRLIAEAADRGERCPTLDQFLYLKAANPQVSTRQLAEAKIIRIEISGHNWRTVWICQGEHRGKHTKLPTHTTPPYVIRGGDRPLPPGRVTG